MNWNGALPLLVLATSLAAGLVIFFLSEEQHRLRTTLNLGAAVVKMLLVGFMLWGVYRGEIYEVRLDLLPGMPLLLRVDSLSLLFGTLSAGLWLLTTVYAIGYLEGSPQRSRFFGFFSLCVMATMGIALAGNLITFFIFYEILTLATYPLVAHRGTAAALRAARIYLGYTLGSGAVLLAGIVWIEVVAGPLEFAPGGAIGHAAELPAGALVAGFWLLIAGLGVKAALVPLHGWLPIAMVAPAPVSALLHAVAVVKAGAFGVIRVVHDIFGPELASELGVTMPLAMLAAFTILYGSIRALYQDDLKRRLAFSTVSQVSYITLGIALAGPLAATGGIVHLVHQGVMKITLFLCAGNLSETLGIHRVSEMDGVGRRMPWTMAAFSLAALGMIGLPPLAGFVSKWYLALGALEVGQSWVVAALLTSSVLNSAYFLPVLYAAWFRSPQRSWPRGGGRGAYGHAWLLLPPLTTAIIVLAVGVLAAADGISPLYWAARMATLEVGR